MNHVGDRVPLAIQLADLLLIDFEQEGDLVIMLGCFSPYSWQIERAARSRIQDAHQSALSIAVPNMKLHVCSPLLRWFLFQKHFRQRRARRNHRENVGLRSAIEYE
jgi:hypothetical protein